MRAAAAAMVVAGAVVLAEPAAAATVPLVGEQVFVQHDAPSPLVVAAVVDEFTAPDGTDLDGWVDTVGRTWAVQDGALQISGGDVHLAGGAPARATVDSGQADVLVLADLELPDPDRDTGVVVGSGPAGELRVVVRRDGSDSAVAVILDDGAETLLGTSTAVGSGLPPTAALRVEHRGDQLRAWLDGTLVVDLPLGPAAAAAADQPAQGVVVGRAGDAVERFVVLSPQV